MMIRFGKLIIEGFCSIANYETELDEGNMTIIRGENGVGKTTILAAIAWVIFGKLIKEDVKSVNTWPKFRTKDYKGTRVEIYWNNGSTLHQVIRCSNYTGKISGSKGGSRLIYLIEGIEVKNKKKLEIQPLIESNLGVSFPLFKNSIMFGQGLKRLIQESGADKKKLFEEVFDVSYLTKTRIIAQKEREKVKAELSDILNPMNVAKASWEANREAYVDAKTREELRTEGIKKETKKYNWDLEYLRNSIKDYDGELSKKLLAKAKDKKARLKEKQSELIAYNNENKDKISSVTTIEGLGKLIRVIMKLILTNPKKAISKLKELESTILEINSYNDKYKRLSNKISQATEAINELNNEVNKAENVMVRIKDIEGRLSLIKAFKADITSPQYRAKYKKYKKEYRTLLKSSKPIEKNLHDYDWVIEDPLGSNGIKSYIFESSMDSLNEILTSYSEILGLRIEFGVDLSNTRKDFYTLVELNGIIVDYAELSGGQKQLVNLAMAFAMWESTSNIKDINVLFLDEVFESLSRSNIEVVVELIRHISKGKSIYLITHLENLPLSKAKVLNLSTKKGLTTFN